MSACGLWLPICLRLTNKIAAIGDKEEEERVHFEREIVSLKNSLACVSFPSVDP